MHKVGTPLVGTAIVFAVVCLVPLPFFDVSTEAPEKPPVAQTIVEEKPTVISEEKEIVVDDREVVSHVPLPEAVKSIYMSSCVAGTPSFRERLRTLINETEVNAVMIDIKDYSGTIAFSPESADWKPAWQAAECGARDMKEFIASLHADNIFVIGRITVFQDPFYAPKNPDQAVLRSDQETVWTDYKGLSFVDVASKEYWDHVIELAVESYNLGFDEINFDYVRYPSDGNMLDTYFPQSALSEHGLDKPANLEAFFTYLHSAMTDEENFAEVKHENTGRELSVPYTSADLFGMTTTNYDDLSIGQIQDRAAPHFDFIAPMVYPSHYPNSFLGLGNPNEYPYKVVYHAMKTGADRMTSSTTPLEGFLHEPIYTTNASGTETFTGLYSKPSYGPEKFRTWIQDFDYGGDYDAADVRAQIQASYDAGVGSWMIWAPSNIYTRAALLPAD
tara:strand:- start:1009 stop:2346 length:1338 start_codon:yes stop_codon:yes gene_type:complete